ncbi:MAG: PQQ-dependent sugar dehydrogenase [Puia sp.]|nr:PQQ-dependent sugar dehydrogenase [Puia sp.]
MKKPFLPCLGLILCGCFAAKAQQTFTENGETFKLDTLYPDPTTGATAMNTPWEVLYGPDDSLWVTEAHNYRIWKIHPGNKGSRMILDLNGKKDFTNPPAWPQGGLMGLAIHPGFYTGKPWIYIAYVYHLVGCNAGAAPCSYNTKIVRYSYNAANGSLSYMDDVISGLNGSNDHNSGRLRIDPLVESDGKYHLYYTIGDMGAGNLANVNRQNNAQDTTILEGKVLRLNTEPDAAQTGGAEWIPDDNPFPAGGAATNKSAIYSYGHRNPQGLVFGSVDGGASYHLYSSEHGDQSDDEVNIIWPHTNYGWPKVAGLCDDNYTSTTNDSMYLAGKSVINETSFCATHDVQEPIFSFYNWSRHDNKVSGALGNMSWPTIAPASIAFYDQGGIPNWRYSLLIPSLKNGLFRLKLKADGLSVDSSAAADTIHYLAGYRLRNITIAPTGDTLFVAVDNSCCTLGNPGIIGNSVASPGQGYILRLVYLTVLALKGNPPPEGPSPGDKPSGVKVYPNPASKYLRVDCSGEVRNPLLVRLYDMTSRLVFEEQSAGDSFTLDIHTLKTGIYIFKLYDHGAQLITTEKIVVF